jgi:hypothetical protein
MEYSMTCYHCGKPGHFAAACPLMIPAASNEEHLARIDGYVAAWVAGEITTERKRKMISGENVLHYGPDVRRALVWP